MRVTRNYMSALLNGNNGVNGTSSLLQRALSRSSKSKRSSRNALLTATKNNNAYSNLVKNSAGTEKLYQNMKYHAEQVMDYADRLTDKSDTSLFAKAKESGKTDEIVSSVKGFVGQYNKMIGNLKESGSRTEEVYLHQFNSMSSLSSSELASCGVKRNSDGTLSVDDKKLAETDLETLEKVWHGSGSFAGRASLWADSVESTAERSMKAEASTAYSNLFNGYGSRGNYFNFFS